MEGEWQLTRERPIVALACSCSAATCSRVVRIHTNFDQCLNHNRGTRGSIEIARDLVVGGARAESTHPTCVCALVWLWWWVREERRRPPAQRVQRQVRGLVRWAKWWWRLGWVWWW